MFQQILKTLAALFANSSPETVQAVATLQTAVDQLPVVPTPEMQVAQAALVAAMAQENLAPFTDSLREEFRALVDSGKAELQAASDSIKGEMNHTLENAYTTLRADLKAAHASIGEVGGKVAAAISGEADTLATRAAEFMSGDLAQTRRDAAALITDVGELAHCAAMRAAGFMVPEPPPPAETEGGAK